MPEGVQLVDDLVSRFPALRDVYDAHVFNQDGVLPHVFFWDLTQEVVQAFISAECEMLDWRGILDFLEERMATGGPDVVAVIVTSFLEYLPYPTQPGHELAGELGDGMSRRFRELRG